MKKLRRLVPLFAMALSACSPTPFGIGSGEKNESMSPHAASEVYVRKGVTYMEAGEYEIALGDLNRAVELDKHNSEAHNALAVLYQRLERPKDAEESFKRAVAAKPDNFSARNNFGRFLCDQGKTEDAMAQFETAFGSKLYETPWIPLTNAGVCAHKAGRSSEAEDYLRRALDQAADFPPALLEMAKLSRERNQPMSTRAFLQRYHGTGAASPESLWLGLETEMELGNADSAAEYAKTLQERFRGSKEAVQARRRMSGD